MGDPFANPGGELVGGLLGPTIEHQIRMNQIKKAKAIEAYRNNLALPDVHVAEHWEWAKPLEPKVVGDDGEELTLEKRRQIMADKRKAVENGDLVQGVDYTEAFDEDIGQERLGEAAENNREGIRVVRPIDEDSPTPENKMAECLYTSGHDAVIDSPTLSNHTKYAMKAIIDASLERRARVHQVSMSHQTLKLIERMLKQDGIHRYWGSDIKVNDKLGNVIRFEANPYYPETANKYSVVFVHRDMYNMWGVDPAAETDILPAIEEAPNAES